MHHSAEEMLNLGSSLIATASMNCRAGGGSSVEESPPQSSPVLGCCSKLSDGSCLNSHGLN